MKIFKRWKGGIVVSVNGKNFSIRKEPAVSEGGSGLWEIGIETPDGILVSSIPALDRQFKTLKEAKQALENWIKANES